MVGLASGPLLSPDGFALHPVVLGSLAWRPQVPGAQPVAIPSHTPETKISHRNNARTTTNLYCARGRHGRRHQHRLPLPGRRPRFVLLVAVQAQQAQRRPTREAADGDGLPLPPCSDGRGGPEGGLAGHPPRRRGRAGARSRGCSGGRGHRVAGGRVHDVRGRGQQVQHCGSARLADRRRRVQRHQVRHGVLPRAGRRRRLQRQRRHHRDRAGLHQPQVLRRRRRLRRGPGERPRQELAEAAGARREAHRFQGGERSVLRGVHAAEPRRAAAAHPLGHRDGVQRLVQPPLHGDGPVHRRRGVREVQASDRAGGSIFQVDMRL